MNILDKIINLDTVDSTNSYAKEVARSPLINKAVIIAKEQTQGRGQFNRAWHSEKNSSILLSYLYKISNPPPNIYLSTLLTAIAITRALQQFNLHAAKIKWPNDIYYNNKKLAGILVESNLFNNKLNLIIGLGLNLKLSDKIKQKNPWTDLIDYNFDLNNKDKLIETIVNEIDNIIEKFSQSPNLDFIMPEFNAHDYLFNKEICLKRSGETFSGVAKGINTAGNLLLETSSGIKSFISGETSFLKL